MRPLSTALVLSLLVGPACFDGDGSSPTTTTTVAADEAARAACAAWHDVLAQLGDEEYLSSGQFLPQLDAIAFHALPSSVPGLAVATADFAARARRLAGSGGAVGYEDAARQVEAACARAGLGLAPLRDRTAR